MGVVQQTRRLQYFSTRDLRPDCKIDVARSYSTRGEEGALLWGSESRRIDVQNNSAGDGLPLGSISHNESIADKREQRRAQSQLSDGARANSKGVGLGKNYFGEHARAAVVNINRCARFDRGSTSETRGTVKKHVNCASWLESFTCYYAASLDSIGSDRNVREIHRRPHLRLRHFEVAVMRLHGTYSRRNSPRLDQDRLAAFKLAASKRSRYDGSDAMKRKCAIDEQPRFSDVAWR